MRVSPTRRTNEMRVPIRETPVFLMRPIVMLVSAMRANWMRMWIRMPVLSTVVLSTVVSSTVDSQMMQASPTPELSTRERPTQARPIQVSSRRLPSHTLRAAFRLEEEPCCLRRR